MWRLLDDGVLDGRTNMAVDEALLEAYRQGSTGTPTLRFYRWDVPTVSLGYAQQWTTEDEARCRALGVAIVRRPSGGRAVLHEGEITYSVVGGERHGLGGGIHETYCLITNALRRGLQRLGVETIIGSNKAAGWEGAACFQVGTAADLMWQGRKIAGSAQCRRGDAFLQHGSVLIDQDLERLGQVLATPLAMAEAAVNLQTAAGRRFEWRQVMEELTSGFSEHFGVELQPGGLSVSEKELTEGLLKAPKR